MVVETDWGRLIFAAGLFLARRLCKNVRSFKNKEKRRSFGTVHRTAELSRHRWLQIFALERKPLQTGRPAPSPPCAEDGHL